MLEGNVEQAIALTSPDEDAALHDYGKLIVDRAHYSPAPVHINDIQFTDTAISGGTHVSLKSLSVTADGQTLIDGLSGVFTTSLGHGNRPVIEAITRSLMY